MIDYWQEILAFGILSGAVFFLVRKFIAKPLASNSKSGCGDDDCGCH